MRIFSFCLLAISLLFCLFVLTGVVTLASFALAAQEQEKKNIADSITATVFVSDISGKRLQQEPNLVFSKKSTSSSSSSSFALANHDDAVVQTFPQKIIGFGGSFMRSGAILFNQLSTAKQDQLMKDLFDPVNGAHFTVGKLSVAATDFMPPYWYSYHDDQNGNFSILHDLTTANNGTIPFAKKAFEAAGGIDKIKIESTMDYPPQWMLKNNGASLPGAQVNESLYPQMAQYFVDFFTAFADNGVPISFLDCFNEPFESYVNMTQSQVADFIKNHMGPLMKKLRQQQEKGSSSSSSSSSKIPLLSWGAQYGRTISKQQWLDFVNNDAELLQYIDFFAVHGYDSHFVCQEVNQPPVVTNGWNTSVPGLDSAMNDFKTFIDTFASNFYSDEATTAHYYDKPTLMTEVCYAIEFDNYPSNTSLCPKLPRTDFLDSMQWGRMLFGDLGAGASGWIYWNLLLDTQGGPYLVSPQHNDPDNNIQQPLVVVDPSNDEYTLTGIYYAMSHFSKWVVPGMAKVENFVASSSLPPNVHGIAFVEEVKNQNDNHNNNCRFVLIFMNDRTEEFNVTISLFSGTSSSSSSSASFYENTISLSPVSFTTMEFFANATLQNVTIKGESHPQNGGGKQKKDDELKKGWEGPVLGTIFALLFVAGVSIAFMKKQRREQQEQQLLVNNGNGGGSSSSGRQQQGEYKQMA